MADHSKGRRPGSSGLAGQAAAALGGQAAADATACPPASESSPCRRHGGGNRDARQSSEHAIAFYAAHKS